MSVIAFAYGALAFLLALGILVTPAIVITVALCKYSAWNAKSKVTLARLVVAKSLVLDPLALIFLGSSSSLMVWCRTVVTKLPDWAIALSINAVVWGLIVLFVQLLLSTMRAEGIRRRGVLGTMNGSSVRFSSETVVPAVAGLVRPTILLPRDSEVTPTSMAHETAHIRNHDLGWMFLAKLFAAAFSMLPWAHRLCSELLLWQEIIADEASAQVPGACKRNLANEITGFGLVPNAGLLSMSGEGVLVSRRIMYLYRRESVRTVHGAWLSVVLVLVTPSMGLLLKPEPVNTHSPIAARIMIASPVR